MDWRDVADGVAAAGAADMAGRTFFACCYHLPLSAAVRATSGDILFVAVLCSYSLSLLVNYNGVFLSLTWWERES